MNYVWFFHILLFAWQLYLLVDMERARTRWLKLNRELFNEILDLHCALKKSVPEEKHDCH